MGLIRRGVKTVAERLAGRSGNGLPPGVDGEAPASWYDDLYSDDAGYREPYRKSYYYFLWCMIAEHLRHAGWPPVLEVGCGPGRLARLLVDQGLADYAGFDFSEVAVGMARRLLPDRQIWQGDARDPNNYAKAEYRAVVCTEVLEHIEEDYKVILATNPGTLFIATVPSFDYPSHVRTFPDAASVRRRYLPYLQDLEVTSWPSPKGDEGARFHLMTGVRIP